MFDLEPECPPLQEADPGAPATPDVGAAEEPEVEDPRAAHQAAKLLGLDLLQLTSQPIGEWSDVLQAKRRELHKAHHSDKGGSDEAFRKVRQAHLLETMAAMVHPRVREAGSHFSALVSTAQSIRNLLKVGIQIIYEQKFQSRHK